MVGAFCFSRDNLTITPFWFWVLMMSNETAEIIQSSLGPQLDEFLDSYLITGIKAGTKKKVIVVKMQINEEELKTMLRCAELWGDLKQNELEDV